MKVRLIEDNADIAELVALALNAKGLDVETVETNFAQVLDPAAWEGYEVAVVDLMLPGGLTGVDILKWLTLNVPHVRRISLSANPLMSQDAIPYVDAVLAKPTAIIAILDAILGR